MNDKVSLYTTWPMVKVTHVASGNGRTLCGSKVDGNWEEGGFIDADEDDGISCLRCQAAMRRIAKEESNT